MCIDIKYEHTLTILEPNTDAQRIMTVIASVEAQCISHVREVEYTQLKPNILLLRACSALALC